MSDLCVNPKGTVYFYKRKVITLKDTGEKTFHALTFHLAYLKVWNYGA